MESKVAGSHRRLREIGKEIKFTLGLRFAAEKFLDERRPPGGINDRRLPAGSGKMPALRALIFLFFRRNFVAGAFHEMIEPGNISQIAVANITRTPKFMRLIRINHKHCFDP